MKRGERWGASRDGMLRLDIGGMLVQLEPWGRGGTLTTDQVHAARRAIGQLLRGELERWHLGCRRGTSGSSACWDLPRALGDLGALMHAGQIYGQEGVTAKRSRDPSGGHEWLRTPETAAARVRIEILAWPVQARELVA